MYSTEQRAMQLNFSDTRRYSSHASNYKNLKWEEFEMGNGHYFLKLLNNNINITLIFIVLWNRNQNVRSRMQINNVFRTGYNIDYTYLDNRLIKFIISQLSLQLLQNYHKKVVISWSREQNVLLTLHFLFIKLMNFVLYVDDLIPRTLWKRTAVTESASDKFTDYWRKPRT